MSANVKQPAEFPLDILGYITDIMGADILRSKRWFEIDWDSFNALKMLSLTCKSMVPVCRRHLFSIVKFSSSRRSVQSQEERSQFLLEHPSIKPHYIKYLYIDDICEVKDLSNSDYAFLNSIISSYSLISIEISGPSYTWNDEFKVPERTKSIILSLIQVPTLRYLTLSQIEDFPAAVLSCCAGLIRLTLYRINNLTPLITNNAIQAAAFTELVVVTFRAWSSLNNHTNTLSVLMSPISQIPGKKARFMIAIDRLKFISLGISREVEFAQVPELLGRAISLERLALHVDGTEVTGLAGLGSKLASNPHPKLRSVTLILDNVYVQDHHFLSDLNLELKHLSGKNCIEMLKVEALGGLEFLWSLDTKHWATDFDRLMTDSGAFPALRQISIGLLGNIPVKYIRRNVTVEQRHKDYPWEMTEAWFPRLLESTAIRIDIATSVI